MGFACHRRRLSAAAVGLRGEPAADVVGVVAEVASDASTPWSVAAVAPLVEGLAGDAEELRDVAHGPQLAWKLGHGDHRPVLPGYLRIGGLVDERRLARGRSSGHRPTDA